MRTIKEDLLNAWDKPSSEIQKQACKKSIDRIMENCESKVDFLIELRNFLLDYAELEQSYLKEDTCDNVDCQGDYNKVYSVEMRKDLGGEEVKWCKDCIERDRNCIASNLDFLENI